MFFKRLLVALLSLILAYAPVAHAQAQALAAFDIFMATVTTWGASTVAFSSTGTALASSAAPLFTASTFVGGGTAISSAAVAAVGTQTAAVTVTGAAVGADIFAAARLLALGSTGVVGIGLTALTLTPMIQSYFNNEKVSLGPLPEREGDTPFTKLTEVQAVFWTKPGGGDYKFTTALAGCKDDTRNVGVYFDYPGASVGHCYIQGGGGAGDVYSKVAPGLLPKPASWDDIAPYMDKPTSPDVFKALLDAGAKIKVTPRSIILAPNAEVLDVPTKTVVETPEKITTTTTTPKTSLSTTEKLNPADPTSTTKVPVLQGTPSTSTTVVEKDKATGVEKLISTTTTEAPKPSETAPTETPDLCALHPEIVACASVDQVDMCKVYPDSLACQKTDEPEVPDLEEKEKPITFTPDTGWGSSTGSCPAPLPLSSAAGAAFSFQPYCDFASGIRPVLVGVAWFTGALILIGANRKD